MQEQKTAKNHQQHVIFTVGYVFVVETTAAVPSEAETREIPGMSSRFYSFSLVSMSLVPYSTLDYAGTNDC